MHRAFIDCTLRGKDIRLTPRKICEILGVSCEVLLVDDMKTWPNIPGFVPYEAIEHLCEVPAGHGLRKPNAHSLSIKCRVLYHIITFSIIPRGGHREELSYLEAFLVDSLLMGLRVNLGCHAPFPGPTRLADPNRFPERETQDWDSFLFFVLIELIPVGMAHTYNNSKYYIQVKRTTTGVVSIKIYTHITESHLHIQN